MKRAVVERTVAEQTKSAEDAEGKLTRSKTTQAEVIN